MTEHAIVVGQFIGYGSLATGDVRLKIDIPREHVSDALRIFGDAIGAQVSVARLNETAGEGRAAPVPTSDGPGAAFQAGASRPPDIIPAELGGKPGAKSFIGHSMAEVTTGLTVLGPSREPIPTTAPGRPRLERRYVEVVEPGDVKARKWHELTRTQQAVIRCGDERFQLFVHRGRPWIARTKDEAAHFVREHCKVSTRAHLDTDSIAAAMWDALDLEYRTWAGLEAEPR